MRCMSILRFNKLQMTLFHGICATKKQRNINRGNKRFERVQRCRVKLIPAFSKLACCVPYCFVQKSTKIIRFTAVGASTRLSSLRIATGYETRRRSSETWRVLNGFPEFFVFMIQCETTGSLRVRLMMTACTQQFSSLRTHSFNHDYGSSMWRMCPSLQLQYSRFQFLPEIKFLKLVCI